MKKISALTAAIAATAFTACADTSAWTVTDIVDPLDDTVTKSARVISGRTAALAINCRPDGLLVYLQVGLLDMDFHDTRTVQWRVDDNPLVKQTWMNGQKGGAAIMHADADAFINAVKAADTRLVVRSGGETASFRLDGSKQPIAEVLDHCDR